MMLATRGDVEDIARLQEDGWLFDLKIDGVRCVATIDAGKVTLSSRSDSDITSRYPEVVAALQAAFPTQRVVLDGEMAVCGDDGYPSWAHTMKRNAQVRKAAYWAEHLPARFYAFDILEVEGQSLRGHGYANRRQILEAELSGAPPQLQLTPMTADGEALWALVEDRDLEGLVAKRPDSQYRDGRSPNWVKVKRVRTVTCAVGGFDEGTGDRASTFGALHLYLLDEDELVQVGKVGSGFSEFELRKVVKALDNPPVIVEVEYLDYNGEALRQPVFKRLRSDADLSECSISQLTISRRSV